MAKAIRFKMAIRLKMVTRWKAKQRLGGVGDESDIWMSTADSCVLSSFRPSIQDIMVWYFGNHAGSHIKQSWFYVFKTGFKQWPELYAMIFYMGVGTVLVSHTIYTQLKQKDFMARYKRVYHIVRPNDPRLALYPRRFVTDKQFLPKDHPETTRDLKILQLPGLDIHKFDPTVRGKGRDRD